MSNKVKKQYAQEPWGKYLLAKGWEPYNTVSSARIIAANAAEDITKLLEACDAMVETGGFTRLGSIVSDAINHLEKIAKEVRDATGQ